MNSEFTYYGYVMTRIIFKVTSDSCKGTEPNRSLHICSGMTVTDVPVLNIRWYKFNISALILRFWTFLNCRYCRVVLGSSSLPFLGTFWADMILSLANMAFRKHLSGEWFCLPHLKPAWYSTLSTCLSLENWLISFSVNPIPCWYLLLSLDSTLLRLTISVLLLWNLCHKLASQGFISHLTCLSEFLQLCKKFSYKLTYFFIIFMELVSLSNNKRYGVRCIPMTTTISFNGISVSLVGVVTTLPSFGWGMPKWPK